MVAKAMLLRVGHDTVPCPCAVNAAPTCPCRNDVHGYGATGEACGGRAGDGEPGRGHVCCDDIHRRIVYVGLIHGISCGLNLVLWACAA